MKVYIMLILIKFRLFILFLMQKWNNFLFEEIGDKMHKTGELIVSGEGEVKIELKYNPINVKVFFDDDPVVVPCNPHHHDHLHWHVKNLHHHHKHDHRHDHCNHDDKFELVITWKVHNLRVIKWTITY